MIDPSYVRSAFDPERVMQMRVHHWSEQGSEQREEQLTVEEPFEVRIGHRSLAVIMRTPGNDAELALGFLLTEGVIQQYEDVLAIENEMDENGLPLANVLNITLRNEQQQAAIHPQPVAFERHFAVSASCGLCGKNSIADLMISTSPLELNNIFFHAPLIYKLSEHLRAQQSVFHYTGGLHAAGLFTASGELLLLREDVGRHNAVDKIIGYGLMHDIFPYQDRLLLVSGRTSFEIIQKALLARIPCIAAISAPSSLAVELAERSGITLIGFLRGHAMNVYTHPERVIS